MRVGAGAGCQANCGRDDLQVVRTLASRRLGAENAALLGRTRQLELEGAGDRAAVQFALIRPTFRAAGMGGGNPLCSAKESGDFDALPTGMRPPPPTSWVTSQASAGRPLMVAPASAADGSVERSSPHQLLGVITAALRATAPAVRGADLRLGQEGEVIYALASQPGPICRRVGGRVDTLATPTHRPVGALREAGWDLICSSSCGRHVVSFGWLTDARKPAR